MHAESRSFGDFLPALAAVDHDHVAVAVNVTDVGLPGAEIEARTALLPALFPSVSVVSASPLASVATDAFDTVPLPSVTVKVTTVPATGRPWSSTTRTVNAVGRIARLIAV